MKRLLPAACVAAIFLVAGCVSARKPAPRPGLTYVGSKDVELGASLINNVLVVETRWDKFGPYHFIVDTGSSVNLVSPEIAARYPDLDSPPPNEPQVRVRSTQGGSVLLSKTTIKKIELGKARFEYVPALVYDCSDLSDQFGMRIDGILGFPFFRNTVVTLDYPARKLVLRSHIPDSGLPGETILFNNADKTPLIEVHLGDREFAALIDSGSSVGVLLNPAGLPVRYLSGPVEGPTVSTLAGDRPSRVGRLAGAVRFGSFDLPDPVVGVTDELTSIGGAVLSHFVVTFDPAHDQVFFAHDPADSLASPPLRGTGLGFRRTPAYWKVAGVAEGSPAKSAGIVKGDIISRINNEPVSDWSEQRFNQLMATAQSVDLTVLNGTLENLRKVGVVDLVP